MEILVNGVTLESCIGDIANQQDMDAVVNAANAQLQTGSGVAGALHRAAGPGLAEECRAYAPIQPGDAIITSAHNLPNRYVIHCLGPVYGRDEPADELLASCYRRALQLAEDNSLSSLCFPAISTGAFGFPLEEATEIAVNTVREVIAERSTLKRIRFILHDENALQVYTRKLQAIRS
ncbi:macro domain-containing protein [Proteobacteria bacterium 005FR1]|nr:macro domain-containing protein [Proteobacteria bacterium 005FR1]